MFVACGSVNGYWSEPMGDSRAWPRMFQVLVGSARLVLASTVKEASV